MSRTRWSLRLTLSACMVLLVLAAVAAVFLVQWRAATRSTLDLLGDNASLILDQLETRTRDITDYAERHVAFVAAAIGDGSFPLDDRPALANDIKASLAGMPQILAAGFMDADLQMVGLFQQEDGAYAVQDRPAEDARFGQRLLEQATHAEGAFWGELIYIASFGRTFVNVWHPVHRDGALIGVFGVAISLAALSEAVVDAAEDYRGTGFILYGQDKLLAHPALASGHPDLSPETPTVAVDRVGDLVLAALLAKGWESIEGVEGMQVVPPTQIGGNEYLAFVRWLEDTGVPRWGLGVWIELGDFGQAWRDLQQAAWVAGAAVLVAVFLALYLGHRVARPVRAMASAAARIGDFELTEVEPLEHSRISELDDQATAFNRMLTGLRSFETYVPKTLVRQLIRRGAEGRVATQTRELTIMFTDIAGYTSMSEGMSAEDVADFLNGHFAILGGCIEAEQGTIDKFIGDAVMAFWGAPEAVPAAPAHACAAALGIRDALDADNRARQARGQPAVRIRIGIHTGDVVVGNIGMPGRINYTVVGDAVNACQRIEALGKELAAGDAAAILISESVRDRLPADFVCEPAGSFELRGRRERVAVYRLTGRTPGPAD